MSAAVSRAARLAGPRLKAHVDAYRHRYRGKIWYVFHDRAANRVFRVSGEGADLIGALDGRREIDEIARDLRLHGDVAADPGHIAGFVNQLASLDLLATGAVPDIARLDARSREATRRRWIGQIRSPMSFRIPLFDPTALLVALMPWLRWVFTPWGAALWLAVVGSGGVIGLMHWRILTEDAGDRLLSTENLFVAGLVYPIVKALHELGHGIALRRLGLEIHQVGILVAAFIPTPYVDASASILLERRRDRVLIAAAGMAVELFLGGLSLILWSAAEPGPLRAVCYNVIMISGFSTLLFNGNPLQRYDGYYIMTDLLGMPGLGSRAGQYVAGHFRRLVMGDPTAQIPAGSRGERLLYLLYGPASFLYRSGLMLVIAFYVARKYPSVGMLLGAWTVGGYLYPALAGLWQWTRAVHTAPAGHAGRRGAAGLGLLAAALAFLLFAVPLPHAVIAQGVADMPDRDVVRPGTAGIVADLAASGGSIVHAGQLLARLDEPIDQARLARAQAAVAEARARRDQALDDDHARAGALTEQLAQQERERDDAARIVAELQVRSPANGVLLLASEADFAGRFAQKGERLATIWDGGRAVIRAMVPLSDAEMLRGQTRRIDLRPAWNVAETLPATLLRIVPQAGDSLPGSALSLEGGGPFAGARDGDKQFHAREALFEVDVRPRAPLPMPFLNGRFYVRFALPPEPAGAQIFRAVRLVFLRWLNA